jgi:polyisoprenoid-binding protein YceI
MDKFILVLLAWPFMGFSQESSLEKRYELSLTDSKITWKGENFGGAGGHEGTIQPASGYLQISSNQIKKGDFVMDMNSIRNTDQRDEQGRKDLEEHLRSDDFFSVDQFPKAFFSITKVTQAPAPDKLNMYIITGFLGIKGITNTISFPASIEMNNQVVHAKADIVFDRTKWNVVFQSKTIFSNLKEGILSDDVKISVDLIFNWK